MAAVAVVTWLANVAMVARVVMGVVREALVAVTAPSATVVETLPVPRLDTPEETNTPVTICPHTDRRTSDRSLPVVALTTSVVTAGLVPTAPGDTSLTPLMGTVLRIVPGIPGAPFNTTWT